MYVVPDKLVSLKPSNLAPLDAAPEDSAGCGGSTRRRRRKSRSPSSRSRSRSPRGERGDPAPSELRAGDLVEIHGLSSASGAQLNGAQGTVLQLLDGRFDVCLGADKVVSLKAANLTKRTPQADAPQAPPPPPAEETAKKAEAPSLASLLSMGRAETKEEAASAPQYESVWNRNGGRSLQTAADKEQMDLARSFAETHQKAEAAKEGEVKLAKLKAVAELAIGGVSGPELLGMLQTQAAEDAEAAAAAAQQ